MLRSALQRENQNFDFEFKMAAESDQVHVLERKIFSSAEDENYLDELDPAVKGVKLVQCNLKVAPRGLDELSWLTTLHLHRCRFQDSTLGGCLAPLERLVSLSVNECGLREFPTAVTQVKTLQTLNLGNSRKCPDQWKNYIKHVPLVVGQMLELRHLDLSWCKLQRCPLAVSQLTNLESLDLRGNFYMESLNVHFENLPRLKFLDMSYCGLSKCPEFPSEMKSLKHLDVGVNPISELPATMTNLPHLEHLDASVCELTQFPEGVTGLASLVYVNLSGNNIRDIPDCLTQVTNLRHLDISNCGLTRCPDFFHQMSSLQHLDLSDNDLGDIPDSLGALPNLEMLRLVNCNLQKRPRVLSYISRYAVVNLEENPLEPES